MIPQLSVRRLLACLNISVYAPAVSSKLFRLAAWDEKTDKKQSLFSRGILFQGMCFSAFCGFMALQEAALPFTAGIAVMAVCFVVSFFVHSTVFRYFLWAGFSAGELFCAFLLSSFDAAVFTGILLFASGAMKRDFFRQTLLALLFCFFLGNALFAAFSGEALFYLTACLSVTGTAVYIFPVRYFYWRPLGIVFLLIPLVLLLLSDIMSFFHPVFTAESIVWIFEAELLFLTVMLWKEMERKERLFCFFLLAVCAFLPPGIAGSAVAAVLAFLGDARRLGKTAGILLLSFCVIWLLSLPLNFLATALLLSMAAGIAGFKTPVPGEEK